MSDICDLQQIRQRILNRYRTDPMIRVNVSLTRPKLRLENVPAKLVGVYPYIFQIEEESSGRKVRHSLQYAAVLLHDIEIIGL